MRDAGCNLTVTEDTGNRDEGSALPRSATPKVTAEQNRHSSAGHLASEMDAFVIDGGNPRCIPNLPR